VNCTPEVEAPSGKLKDGVLVETIFAAVKVFDTCSFMEVIVAAVKVLETVAFVALIVLVVNVLDTWTLPVTFKMVGVFE
jgi:hypothetical protein